MKRAISDGAVIDRAGRPLTATTQANEWPGLQPYLLAITAFAVVFTFWRVSPVPLIAHLEGTLLAAISLFPLYLWYRRGAVGAPMFELVSLSFGAQYALPLYLQPNSVVNGSGEVAMFSWGVTEQTLALAIIGVAMLQGGYYGARASFLTRALPRFVADLNQAGEQRYLLTAGILGLLALLGASFGLAPSNSGPFGYFVRFMELQALVAIALLAYRTAPRKSAPFGWHLALWVWVGITVLVGLASTALENVLIPVLLVIVVRWEIRRKLPWKAVLLGVLAFVLFDSVKAEYRAQEYARTDQSIVQKANLWIGDAGDALSTTLSGNVLGNAQARIDTAAGRLDLLHPTALVEELTPAHVPYLSGKSYGYINAAVIPRLLWPNKPSTSEATNVLALRYGLLTPSQVGKNSVGIGQIAEAYANFGSIGVVVVLAIEGVIFGVLATSLNTASIAGRALFIAIMVYFLNGIGTSTAVTFGGLIENVLPAVLVILVFCRLNRSPTAPRSRSVARQ